MEVVTIQEAQANLTELIHRLIPGDELLIIEDDHPVARLVPTPPEAPRMLRKLGTLRGTIIRMAEDFDAPLEDFKEYME